MKTRDGFIPLDDKENIFFANTEIKEATDQSDLLQLFLRKDAFYSAKFPKISEAVRYFKKTEGGRSDMCKTVENYAKNYAKQERLEILQRMIRRGDNIQQTLELGFTEEEYQAAELAMSSTAPSPQ